MPPPGQLRWGARFGPSTGFKAECANRGKKNPRDFVGGISQLPGGLRVQVDRVLRETDPILQFPSGDAEGITGLPRRSVASSSGLHSRRGWSAGPTEPRSVPSTVSFRILPWHSL